jgi:hypothetical protein
MLWRNGKILSEVNEKAGVSFPFVTEYYSNVSGVARMMLKHGLKEEGNLLEQGEVHSDLLYYVDDEGEPHLVVGLRFSTGKPRPQKPSRREAEEKERELIPTGTEPLPVRR